MAGEASAGPGCARRSAAAVRRPRRPRDGGAVGDRGRGGRWHRVLRLGSPELAGAGAGGGRPWITLAAAATATERLRLGPMVTPLARRRQAKAARETVTLDRLSGGRLTLGVGLGSDRFGGEFSATGEQLDDRMRSQMLDEALQILAAAWSGLPVHHRGAHYTIDGLRFLPRPVQQPGVPVWVAGFPGNARPLRRAARSMASSRSTWNTRTSSPRSPPPSPGRAGTRPRLLTSR